jgi:hypothetical protein
MRRGKCFYVYLFIYQFLFIYPTVFICDLFGIAVSSSEYNAAYDSANN